MYILGKNPDIQKKLYEEIKNYIDNGGQFDSDGVQKMPYLRGLMKETQRYISDPDTITSYSPINSSNISIISIIRIYPVVQGILRVLAQDTILSGYHVPANVSTHSRTN